MDRYFLIIDGSSLLFTQYYGNLPKEIMFEKDEEKKKKLYHKIMMTSKGVYTNAVYGFLRYLFKVLKSVPPTHLVVNWDVSRETFRTELYPDYKANRGEMPEPLGAQFDLCQDILAKMGIPQLWSEVYEADDFSGTVARRFENEIPVRIISKDKDYLQLVTENTNLWIMLSSSGKAEELYKKYKLDPAVAVAADRCFPLTPELVEKEYGVEPKSVPSLKGLMGDPSDNIKGVPGIGEKAATALISRYKTVDALFKFIGNPDDARKNEINALWKSELGLTRSPLPYLLKETDGITGEQAARMCEKIATIKCDVPLEKNSLSDYELKINEEEARKALIELEMKSLLEDIPKTGTVKQTVNIRTINDFNEAGDYLDRLKDCKIAGFSVCIENGTAYYCFCTDEKEEVRIEEAGFISADFIFEKLEKALKCGLKLSAFNIKQSPAAGLLDVKNSFDPALAAYLLDPLKNDYVPKDVVFEHAPEYSAFPESAAAFVLKDILEKKLEAKGLLKLYNEIEMPLLFVLKKMEDRGIKVDTSALEHLGQVFGEEIDRLTEKIYSETGCEFNINSPKQLGEILFEKLGLPHGKKTKNGYSTSVEVLESLKEDYPVVAHILEFRQLTKLKSTYADALIKYTGTDGRIHCKFNQTVTATGRLSCTDPNLQNIPVRTALGREIRKVFVAEEGHIFVDADYSQIELRVLAALSGDEELKNAYETGVDVHTLTASKVFGIPADKVDADARRRAKTVNFGIVYGISSFGLGADLGLSRKEAEKFINQYFESYPSIKQYLDSLIKEGYKNGCVKTAFGRIRPIPELSSGNFMQRQFGERVAMNSPIQGTAADIIKIAMIRVEKRLEQETKDSKLLLQIHDELLIETTEAEKDTVKRILSEEMPGAYDNGIRLEIEINEGKNWYEAK